MSGTRSWSDLDSKLDIPSKSMTQFLYIIAIEITLRLYRITEYIVIGTSAEGPATLRSENPFGTNLMIVQVQKS
jgi:hypothetical protein